MKKLLFFWKELIATFWFVPILIICFSILLSIGLVSLDSSISISHEGWIRFFLVNSPSSALSILSTISGTMIGVAGTVFSVTLVALTLASSQFGPRLIKNFMYVRLNQVVLGLYISTYLYCLLVLNAVRDGSDYVFIPSISILVAILVTIANIILLIIFIHQMAISIQADKIISDISQLIAKQVGQLFPEEMGSEKEDKEDINENDELSSYSNKTSIKSPEGGYLQYVDNESLMELVSQNDALLRLNHKPGNFIVKGVELGVLYSKKEWEEKSVKKLMEQFVIGQTKTSQQDLEFSILQMVEIASRALSPGVNDPYTAIACINNLTAAICCVAEVKFPSKYRFDEDDKLRIIAEVLTFEELLDSAFNQIRQFSSGSARVIIRLMEALTTMHDFTNRKDYRKVIIKHAEMVMRLGEETIKEKNDLNELKSKAGIIKK